jgi:tripartite ATP-independent transporter DctM subunit
MAASSGVATDAYIMANKWLGRLRGGLVLATIGASGLIAATTGSGATSTAVMGKIAVPEMEKYGYNRSLSTGATAACGPLGILIPPSGSFVIIGVLAELSIGRLFIAGIFPGLLTVLVYMTMVWIRCKLNPTLAPLAEKITWKERILSLNKAWGVILIFGVVIGGLYSGIATATEVAALGCMVALIMAVLAILRKRARWSDLKMSIFDTINICAMVFAFIIGSGIFSLFFTLSGIIPQVLMTLQNLAIPVWGVVAAVCFIYLMLGMFFDPMSMVLVTVPILYPILVGGLGVDPIWLSVVTVIMVEVSALTPPVGLNLYIMRAVYPKVTLGEVMRGSMWFVAMNFLVVIILFIFPQIATWLPGLMSQ